MTEALVKGVWFVTARRHILQHHGETVLAGVARAMSDEHRAALLEPLASSWYPEEAFQDAMQAVMREIAHHESTAFNAFIEACTELGVNTFFRVLLRVTTPAFLMRKMPVLSRQYRRNDWVCDVEADDQGATLRWTGVPYLSDRNYRLFMIATMVKCAEMCTGRRPRCDIVTLGADHVTVHVFYGDGPRSK